MDDISCDSRLRFPASDKFPNQPTAPGEWKEEVSPTCSWKNHFHPVSLGLLKLRKQTIWDLRLQLASFVGGVHFGNNLVEKVIHKVNFSETQMLSKVLHHRHRLSWLVHYLQPVLSRVMKQIFVGNHWQSLEMCFCKRSWVIDFIDMIRQLILSNLTLWKTVLVDLRKFLCFRWHLFCNISTWSLRDFGKWIEGKKRSTSSFKKNPSHDFPPKSSQILPRISCTRLFSLIKPLGIIGDSPSL